jgi:hypothetical protein
MTVVQVSYSAEIDNVRVVDLEANSAFSNVTV